MDRIRSLSTAFFLAFVLAVGQYAGALHALGHASEQLSQKSGTPVKVACDQCFTCSQLSGAASTAPVAFVPPLEAAAPLHAAVAGAPVATRVVFRSRAPPVIS